MQFYANKDGAYRVDDEGACKGVAVSVKEKKRTVTEIESVTFTDGTATTLPEDAVPMPLDAIVAKFAVTESNPLKAPGSSSEGDGDDDGDAGLGQESDDGGLESFSAGARSVESIDPDEHTKDELIKMAEEAGVELPSKPTKADIADAINAAG